MLLLFSGFISGFISRFLSHLWFHRWAFMFNCQTRELSNLRTVKPELIEITPVWSEYFTYSQQDRVDFSIPADALRNVIDVRIVTFTYPPVNDKATHGHTNIEMSQ